MKMEIKILWTKRSLYDVFMNGDEEELRELLGEDVAEREGNSLQALLLSQKAFELAHLLMRHDSSIRTATDVANWLNRT